MSETDVRPPPAPPSQPAPRSAPRPPAPEASPGDAWVAPEVEAAPTRRRGAPRWPWIVAGVAAAGAVVWFCTPIGRPSSQNNAGAAGAQGGRGGGGRGGRGGANMPTVVGAAYAEIGDIPITLDEIGTVTPTQTAVVRTQLSGQLLRIGFNEGQFVRLGQVLAEIDPRPYQQQLAQAQGTLARDQALLTNARVDLNRYQTLLKEDSIASQQVDTQAALVRQYEGVVKTDEGAIGSAKLNLAYAHITAPFSGRVGLRAVDAGNYVTPGDANGIVSISQVDPIDVLFTIPQDNLPAVAKRQKSGATLTATAFDRDRSDTLATGRLLTFDNAVDISTGTVRAKARFPNGPGALFPSQFVNVRLLVDTLKGVVTAPSGAVLRGSQGQFVYVVDLKTRKASARTIKVGAASSDRTAVLSGLQAGEVIVTDGTDRLRDGACVILPGDYIPNMGGSGRGGRGGGRGGAAPQAGGAGGASGAGAGAAGTGGGTQGGGASGPGAGYGAGARGQSGGAGAGGRCPDAGRPWNGPSTGRTQTGGQAHGGVFGGGAMPQRSINASAPGAPPLPIPPSPGGALRPAVPPGGEAAGHPAQTGASAQGAPAGAQGGSPGQGNRMLDVLGLDPKQKAQAEAVFAKHPPSDPDDPDSVREARRAAMAELMPLLRPDQRAKFDAWRAQMRARMGGGG